MIKKSRYSISLLIFIFIVQVFIYYLLFKERLFYYFNINTHVHSIDALRFYNLLYLRSPFQNIIHQFFSPGHWPRLHYAFTALFISLFERNYMSMAMVNVLYLLILMISVYGITIEITKNRWCALLSSFLISAYPGTIQFMKIFELPIGVIAFTSLSIYFLILSNYFKKTIYTILFAIFVCFSMYMDRATPIIFIIGPVGYTLYRAIKEIRSKNFDKKISLNIFLMSLIIFIILSPFYITWIKCYLLDKNRFLAMSGVWTGHSRTEVWKQVINFSSPFFFKRIFFYLTVFPNWLLGSFWSILFLCSIPLFLKNKYRHTYIFLWWLILPIIFFTIIPKKDFSYIMPVLSPIAIMTSIGFYSLKNHLLRICSLAIIFLFGIAQFIIFVFCLDTRPNSLIRRKLFTNINMARSDPIIFDAIPPNFGNNKNKNFCRWVSKDVIKFLPLNGKFKIAIVKMRGITWGDYLLGVFMLLRNPLADVLLLFLPPECEQFISSGSDYVVFVKRTDFQEDLNSAVKGWVAFYDINLDKFKINLYDYALVCKKLHPDLPIEIEIYSKSSLE